MKIIQSIQSKVKRKRKEESKRNLKLDNLKDENSSLSAKKKKVLTKGNMFHLIIDVNWIKIL